MTFWKITGEARETRANSTIKMITSTAAGALLTASVVVPATLFTVATAQAQAQPQTQAQATPLPTIPVKTKKPTPKKKPVRSHQPVRSAPVDAVDDGSAERAEEAAPRERALGSAPATTTVVQGDSVAAKAATASDTASLLRDVPGVSLYDAGGVSSLPVIHGLNDDRVRTEINGMTISSACANHMNPPLSYVDPSQVKAVEVIAGVTPVSSGGDSLGGTILVETLPPQFASGKDGVELHGGVSAFVRSNGPSVGGAANASAATNTFAVTYNGAWARASQYDRGGDGGMVPSTEYEAQNHALSLAARKGGDLFILDAGVQHIPYQGFVNQVMDMTLNDAWYVNGRYEGKFDWGKLEMKAYYHHTRHKMDLLQDKTIAWGGGQMPMDTEGEDAGYSIKAAIPLSPRDMLRVGNEFHHEGLNDWWPPIPAAQPGMMCCDTFININNGTRDRLGTFAEWEHKWSREWTTLLGARNDVVWMNTGNVHGYNSLYDDPMQMMQIGYQADADRFNGLNHAKTDVNFDMTALTRYEPNRVTTFEAGYARKTRSPNLNERYSWSRNDMASWMISWFGDLNGYVGDIDLRPETAHTASFTAGWHDSTRKSWELKVTPYYTYVKDYITAELAQPNVMMTGFNELQFVNHDAELYGVDISGRATLLQSSDWGKFAVSGVIGYVHGQDLSTGGSLYHMMPWNARLALEHKLGNWSNAVELQMVDAKTSVDAIRLEPSTPGYALVNLRTSYQWDHIRLDLGVQNLFDQLYYAPLGGVIGAEYMGPHLVPGMGRNVYAAVTMKF
jgi:iron complex outermembrane recepter protein